MVVRVFGLLYGVFAYLVFFGTFLYLIGFVGNLAVPKSISSGTEGNVGFSLVINAFLLTLFALQHSVMARPEFKRWWIRYIPQPLERSTFVLIASATLILLFWQWRPLTAVVWRVDGQVGQAILYGFFASGWTIVFVSTFLIDHFDLFGLRQVVLYFRNRACPPLPFRERGLYKWMRHPLMLGFLVAFWATPVMTLGHLLFSGLLTLYILAAVQLEERDLTRFHGETYRRYQQEVPMFLPLRGSRNGDLVSVPAEEGQRPRV
jgi:methanethiol S-methyltransferase